MSNPEDYAVGWICAISTEYVAAQSFLDEKHGTPSSVAKHDNNDYTLGRIGEHNVVIAVLPDGEYGIASAASVARDMLHSFPNVRIGLMVGIGGGAPSPSHDIRLGDVVVSAPRDGIGGVFQYDFGKTIQNQSFRTTGFLNQPPTVLRTAMAGLKSEYESEGHRFEATIRNILDKKPRLRKKYSRPNQTSDRLYQSNIVHPVDSADSCNIMCGGDQSTLVPRRDREEDEDNPAVHYGLIASANQLMKDAFMRDTLAAEMGVLCFEMEAAGLMNQFPCLVIRGICDYSDSHKNKEWQGYAAMTAAAYAKDLLSRIPPNKVEAEQKIRDTLSQVVSTINHMKSEWDRKEDLEILEWITPLNYGPQHSDFIKRRQPGTGQWLLESAEYKTWLAEKNQTLFCAGIPGSGKTILASIVVEDLTIRISNDADIGLAYIYCNFKRQHEQGIDDMIASLVKQLSRKRPCLPDIMRKLHQKHAKEKTRPSLDELAVVLRSVATMYSNTVVVIDALDECAASDRSRSRLLSYISGLRTDTAVSLFATARHIPAVENEFRGCLRKEVLASEEDMRRYIEAHVKDLPDFLSNRDDLITEIETEVLQAAQGMFLLVHLDLDSLKGKTSIAEVKYTLERLRSRKHEETGQNGLQTALERAYDEALERIDRQSPAQQRLGRNALEWIVCAKRPLTQLELRHVLAVKPGDTAFDPDNVRDVDSIISVCAGLVTIDGESNVVRLVHYTTQEYFDQRQPQFFPDAETRIGVFCCNYLSNIARSGDIRIRHFRQLYPLYVYAGENWGHHARLMPDIPQSVRHFMTCPMTIDAAYRALYVYGRGWNGYHFAASFGICKALDFLSNKTRDLNSRDRRSMTPLMHAVRERHQDMVRLLIEKGAAIELDDETALTYAVNNHDESMIRLLLEMGADIKKLDWAYTRALRSSDASQSNEGLFRLLFKEGAKAGGWPNSGWPLYQAAGCGYENLARPLLEKGGNIARLLELIETVEGRGAYCSWYTMYAGPKQRHARVVELALDIGMSLLPQQNDRQRLFLLAARHGHTEALQILLQQGVAVQSSDWCGKTALGHAAEAGQADIVRLLLDKGPAIDAKDQKGRTPLSLAVESKEECTAVIELLLDRGAKVDARDYDGMTPLMRACTHYDADDIRCKILELLLDRGAAIEARDRRGETALMKVGFSLRYARLLLHRGAKTETKDDAGRTALMVAVQGAEAEIVEVLLSAGAAVDARDNEGNTPLLTIDREYRAADILKQLLDSGASIEERNYSGTTLLMRCAADERILDIMLLLHYGAEIGAKDNQGQTALFYAVQHANLDGIRELLEGGADIETRDNLGQTALMHAACEGRLLCMQTLLDGGAAVEVKALFYAMEHGHQSEVAQLLRGR